MIMLQKSYGEKSLERMRSSFLLRQKIVIAFVLTSVMLFLLNLRWKMVRKYLRKSTPYIHRLEMLILFYIASLKEWKIITQTEVAINLNKAVSTLNYHFTKLKVRGLITKDNHLTNKGRKYLRYLKHWDKTLNKMLRAHKIQIVFHLAKCPDFEKIRNVVFTEITNNRYKGLKCELMGCIVMFYSSKKAVAILPDIYGNNDEELSAAVCDVIMRP